jgi:iron-sulfur cluster repair protein YtfE (RIC family)
MAVQIGAKAHYFNDPTGLLSDCHRRIEMFLGSLEAVATVIDHPPTEDVRRALESALRYFSQPAPKHTADEEQSLFPRPRDSANPEVASALSRLDELEAEHRWADPLHADVERIGVKYLSEGSLSSQDVERFRTAIRDLRSMYEKHIGLEDHIIFPLAARTLTERDRSDIAHEMARRRKVKLVGIGDGAHGL